MDIKDDETLSKNNNKISHNDMITITFGDQAENHAGMEKIGKLADEGYKISELQIIGKFFEQSGYKCDFIHLTQCDLLREYKDNEECKKMLELNPASVLVIRNGIKALLPDHKIEELYKEQKSLKWDTKAYMRGRVVNKHARYNLCYDEAGRKANYENKQGTIISYDDVPLLKLTKDNLEKWFGRKTKNLKAEGNYYYNINKTYISWHGDSERKIVIALRLGYDFPLYFQWYHKNVPISQRIEIKLNNGDIYCMSEKATGFDWRKSSIYTLRHATGASKYIK